MIPSIFQHDPARLALVSDERSVTFGELAALVRERMASFDESTPFEVLAPERTLPDLLTLYAAVEARRPLVLLHARWTAAERARAVAHVTETWTPTPPGEESILAVVFTSGTTGDAKAARLSRRALAAAARASEANLGWRENDRWFLSLPLSHVGGLSVVTRALIAAMPTVVLPPGNFEVSSWTRMVAEQHVTLCSVVPTMLLRILAEPDYEAPPSLRAVLVGGAPASVPILREARRRGIPILRTYGMTETCAQIATESPDAINDVDGGVSFLPGVAARVVDGILEVRTDSLFSGYCGGAPVLPTDWFRTQDLASLDARGRVTILGRADDLVISGGEKIAPAEVEQAAEDIPGVLRACAFGVPDEEWGEAVCLVVCGDATDDALLQGLRHSLAPHKRPKRVAHLPSFPELPSGKIDRAAVRALALPLLEPVA